MNTGDNDLLEACYRNLARETNRVDLIVTIACVIITVAGIVAILTIGLFA